MSVPIVETIRLAADSVWANRFRSGLTILGIVIGITTVVTVASLLTGLRAGIVTFFEEFGPDSVFVSRFSGDPGQGGSPKEQKRRPLKLEYVDFIERTSPAIERISASLLIPSVQGGKALSAKVPGFESDTINLQGRSPNAYLVQPRELREGRVFTPDEANRGLRVCVIGASIAEALYPEGNVSNKMITVDGAEYRVLGVFEKAKGGFFGENGLDRNIEIPYSVARQKYPFVDNLFLTAQAKKGLRDQAFDEFQAAMRRLRNLKPGQENDFNISTADQIIAQFDKITGLIVMVSIAISGLGLLVGGIGVMNIMLVSVTERTREIGIRKALGARRPDIVFQFLLEASSLTVLGGIVGIAFASLVTFVIAKLVPALPSNTPLWAVVAGLGMSIAVGVFFGTWPALKAARLDPVEALRYE
ncbi:ABC transporter permease [Bryobacter aggregatus]|uniref:ABC transporter permease n=1 Tax=Bryobacter aggregatus TaxID=360054 RepID=UPI0004E26DC4|nr:ABC transporter permease [Bryobacter aggregatus]